MTTQTIEKEKAGVRTVAGTLEALDFKASLYPVYYKGGAEIKGYKQVFREDTLETLSIVSDQYKLVEHRDAMAPAVEILGREGWAVKASRVERGGGSAFVELHRRDAVNANVALAVGEKVGERLMLRNSYDKSSSLTFTFGALVLKCTNGLVVPGHGGLGFSGHHSGDVTDNFDRFLKRLGQIENDLGSRMLEYYSKLDKVVPEQIGYEIIKRSVGERVSMQVLPMWKGGIGRDGSPTAWNLYNGITQYLTHDYNGNWDRRERLNGKSLELIQGYVETGTLPAEPEAN